MPIPPWVEQGEQEEATGDDAGREEIQPPPLRARKYRQREPDQGGGPNDGVRQEPVLEVGPG
jgi:hypothetical protein